jgi:hypothetical protein
VTSATVEKVHPEYALGWAGKQLWRKYAWKGAFKIDMLTALCYADTAVAGYIAFGSLWAVTCNYVMVGFTTTPSIYLIPFHWTFFIIPWSRRLGVDSVLTGRYG